MARQLSKQTERLRAIALTRLSKMIGRHHDGKGLYLVVSSPTSASWTLRYQTGGRTHWMGLGPYPEVTLAEARVKAMDARMLRINGQDPLAARRAQRASIAAEVSFKQCAADYIKAKGGHWSPELARQWSASMAHANAVIGDRTASSLSFRTI
jgi:hypothetical protein